MVGSQRRDNIARGLGWTFRGYCNPARQPESLMSDDRRQLDQLVGGSFVFERLRSASDYSKRLLQSTITCRSA